MKKLYVVTTADSPLHQEAMDEWMLKNRCIRIGDDSFLIYDEISLDQAFAKFQNLLTEKARIYVFPVESPYRYRGTDRFEHEVKVLMGDKGT